MNISNAVNQISTTDATIFIAITPVHNAVAILGLLICVIATVSRRICTTGYAIAAAVHILLVCWSILLWIDHINSAPPLLLAVIFRILLLSVSIILVFSASVPGDRQLLKTLKLKRTRRFYDKQNR